MAQVAFSIWLKFSLAPYTQLRVHFDFRIFRKQCLPINAGVQLAGKQPGRKGLGVHLWTKNVLLPWRKIALEAMLTAGRRKWSFPAEATRSTVSISGLFSTRETRTYTGESPTESHKDDEEAIKSLRWRKSQKVGTVYPGEVKASGI